ncbi:MAG: DMT family transporter [Candidatus Methanomethylophilaceae archaeon]|nr:DMT family transporter [Candidatus Methanomethylophilaceae archaeon]
MDDKSKLAAIAVAMSAIMFGSLGIPIRYFQQDCGLPPLDSVVIRMSVSATGLLIIIMLFARDQLKVRLKDVPLLALFGGFKLLSDLTLFNAQNNITLCLATLLQMTAPYFVMIFSMFLFKEKLTLKKMIAMAVGSVGCVLVTGILFGEVDANTEGVISAILSGLFFGMFFIGNRVAVDRDIRPGTTLFYTTVFADLIALPFINHADVLDAVIDQKGAVMALSLGILMTLIPYYLITWSSLHLEPAISSMISTLEVGAAAVVGYVVFRDVLTVSHVIGIVLVLSSIIVVNAKIRTEYIKRYGKYISPLHKFRLKAFGRDEDV